MSGCFPVTIIEEGIKVLNSIEKIYIRDKKEFLHYIKEVPFNNLLQPTPSPTTYIPELTPAHYHLYQNSHGLNYLNPLVPIVKHYEVCEENYKNVNLEDINLFYSNRAAIVFNMIERVESKQITRYINTILMKARMMVMYTQNIILTQQQRDPLMLIRG